MNLKLRTLLMAGLLSPLYSMAATQPAAATLTPPTDGAVKTLTLSADLSKPAVSTAPQYLVAAADTKKKSSDDGDGDDDDDDDDTQ